MQSSELFWELKKKPQLDELIVMNISRTFSCYFKVRIFFKNPQKTAVKTLKQAQRHVLKIKDKENTHLAHCPCFLSNFKMTPGHPKSFCLPFLFVYLNLSV